MSTARSVKASKKGALGKTGAPVLPENVLALLDQLPLLPLGSGKTWPWKTLWTLLNQLGLGILISPGKSQMADDRYLSVLASPDAAVQLHAILTRLAEAGQEPDPVLAVRIAARKQQPHKRATTESCWESGPGLGIRKPIDAVLAERLGLFGSPMAALVACVFQSTGGYELLMTEGSVGLTVWMDIPAGVNGIYPELYDRTLTFEPDTIDKAVATLASECAVVMYAAGVLKQVEKGKG